MINLPRLYCLGEAYLVAGRLEEDLTTAAAMYREMDMGYWLKKAEAALNEPGPRVGR